jgi:radical SAM protein with 4Fe4S-binding SPASM domain
MMVIASSGKVVLCYEDYLETTVMGDVRRETLAAIWHAKKFARHRQALIAGDRTLTRICRRCNNTELMNVEGVY